MLKRKQASTELRTNPVSLAVGRVPSKLEEMWGITDLQPFFPPVECLFKTEALESVRDYGIKLNETIVGIVDDSAVLSSLRTVPVHRKVTMILSPFKWMKGEFGNPNLPTFSDNAKAIHSKMQSPHTAAYVGSILSIALSQSGCEHFPRVFGVFTGNAKKHTIDISDDYEELSDRGWFSQNIGKTFQLRLEEKGSSPIQYTRSARVPLDLGDEIDIGAIETLEPIESLDVIPANVTQIYNENDNEEEDCAETGSDVSTSYIFDIESNDSSVGSLEIEDEPEEDEPFAWAIFDDVAVQMTVMEKFTGTLYDLLMKHSEPEKHYAWISQIIFALAFAQRNFAFTHNDLHGNNVMYLETTKEFLYYSHAGINYKVPTYGYIIKIIDFDRGIGSVRLSGMKEPKLFMSDQFATSEEAGGQYNIPPFYVSSHSTIKPNPSFDLVRLATSLFWDLFPNGPKCDDYLNNSVFKLFIKWMKLDDGTDLLFHKNNPKVDRYPGFNLYKAIARYCRDVAIPRKEIAELKIFIGQIPPGENTLLIDV